MTADELQRAWEGFEPNGSAPRSTIDAAQRDLGIRFPADYAAFLEHTNGGKGPIGQQSYVILWRVEELIPHNFKYRPDAAYAPDLVFIGTDGGNEVFAVRRGDSAFVSAPLIGMSADAVVEKGATMREFLASFS